MAFSGAADTAAFHLSIELTKLLGPGTGFGDMLARAPGRRSAAKLLSEDGTSDRGEISPSCRSY